VHLTLPLSSIALSGRAKHAELSANEGARCCCSSRTTKPLPAPSGRSFERRGYQVLHAPGYEEASERCWEHDPGYAVVDLKLKGNSSGLSCVQLLHAHDAEMLIVVLTGFASIGTAVEAIKLGACQYLAKPSNTDDIEAAFGTWRATDWN
jgi:ActR/RegA family two-component response regulator